MCGCAMGCVDAWDDRLQGECVSVFYLGGWRKVLRYCVVEGSGKDVSDS